jgi:hypothetical protein
MMLFHGMNECLFMNEIKENLQRIPSIPLNAQKLYYF